MRISLPGLGTLGCVVYPGTGIAHSQGVSPYFYPLHVSVDCLFTAAATSLCHLFAHLHICDPPTSLDECGFFKSLVVRLHYGLIF